MDVFELRERVVDDYRAFVTSFMSIKGPRVQEVVDKELADGLLWPEPRIALNPAYADGGWVDELVARGTLDGRCSEIFRLGKDQAGQPSRALRLRRHQVEAIEVARRREPYVLTTGTGSGKSLAYIIPIVDAVLRAGAKPGIKAICVYPMTAQLWSRPGWHWRCFACEEAGREFEAASSARRAFYAHRTSAHGFSPAPAAAGATRVVDSIDLGPEALPVLLPSLSYEEVIAACSGYSNVAASVAAWVALGAVLSRRPDRRFGLTDGGAATAAWTWTANPEYWASASLSPKGEACFELCRSDGEDEESVWELSKPQGVPLLAEAIAAGAPEPPAVRSGPWTEEPFLAWMRGEAAPPWERASDITLT